MTVLRFSQEPSDPPPLPKEGDTVIIRGAQGDESEAVVVEAVPHPSGLGVQIRLGQRDQAGNIVSLEIPPSATLHRPDST